MFVCGLVCVQLGDLGLARSVFEAVSADMPDVHKLQEHITKHVVTRGYR